jgi:chemotaxis protein MotA
MVIDDTIRRNPGYFGNQNREPALRERSEANVLRTMANIRRLWYDRNPDWSGRHAVRNGTDQFGRKDPMEVLGKGMGAAIITTFYGSIMANLVFNPMAVKFETRIERQNILQTMLIEGILLLQARKHPLIVREKLNSFLRPRDWKKPEETK